MSWWIRSGKNISRRLIELHAGLCSRFDFGERVLSFQGRVVTGVGQGAAFTQLDWARTNFVKIAGIDPYPGTLNLHIEETNHRSTWNAVKASPGYRIVATDGVSCDARCYPAQINRHLPGAVVIPEVPEYPEFQVELIAALSVRDHLSLVDGDSVELSIVEPLSVRAVLFDADGTLVDSVDAFRIVAEQAAAGQYAVTREAVHEALNTPGVIFWELVVPEDVEDRGTVIAALRRTAFGLWESVLNEHVTLIPGLAKMLASLRRAGMSLGIVTGSDGKSLEPLREAGLLEHFDVVITAADTEHRKPHPDGLIKAAKALGVSPEQTAYIGDTVIDVLASQAAGMASIAVLTGAGDSARLSAAGPDRIAASVSRLPEMLELP